MHVQITQLITTPYSSSLHQFEILAHGKVLSLVLRGCKPETERQKGRGSGGCRFGRCVLCSHDFSTQAAVYHSTRVVGTTVCGAEL